MPDLLLRPVAFVSSPLRSRIDAPHQGSVAAGGERARDVEGIIELADGLPAEVLRDLDGFEKVWVVYGFHRNSGWKPLVHPPRGARQKRGVFATRSPHRPNALGLTAVTLLGVDGRRLHVRGLDMLDGTPVYDLKPYVPYADAFPDARAGWVDEVEALEPAAPAGEPTAARKPRIGFGRKKKRPRAR